MRYRSSLRCKKTHLVAKRQGMIIREHHDRGDARVSSCVCAYQYRCERGQDLLDGCRHRCHSRYKLDLEYTSV